MAVEKFSFVDNFLYINHLWLSYRNHLYLYDEENKVGNDSVANLLFLFEFMVCDKKKKGLSVL